jgi:hypothetical protein
MTGMTANGALKIYLALAILATTLPGYAIGSVDATQAQAMLKLLRDCHDGLVSTQALERVIALPGTQLIIKQQNISRRITLQQYEAVLTAACKGEAAHPEPSEPGARAQKGVQGLIEDVAPSLAWGRQNTAALQKQLDAANRNSDLAQVVPLAMKNLPEKIDLSPILYFVMGGRAGAAAFDEGIYIDLLSDAWQSRARSTPMTSQEMVEFFAHETHHIGYGKILDQKRQALQLTGGQVQAWDFLVDVLMEGSATLLINAHGSWAELESADHIKPDLARLPKLLPAAQTLLQQSLNGTMGEQQHQLAVSDFFGEGYHATGARLLYVIQEVRGRQGVLRVMDEPRTLLTVYNECAAKTGESFRFDPQLAKQLERMGETH